MHKRVIVLSHRQIQEVIAQSKSCQLAKGNLKSFSGIISI